MLVLCTVGVPLPPRTVGGPRGGSLRRVHLRAPGRPRVRRRGGLGGAPPGQTQFYILDRPP